MGGGGGEGVWRRGKRESIHRGGVSGCCFLTTAIGGAQWVSGLSTGSVGGRGFDMIRVSSDPLSSPIIT